MITKNCIKQDIMKKPTSKIYEEISYKCDNDKYLINFIWGISDKVREKIRERLGERRFWNRHIVNSIKDQIKNQE